MKRTLSFAFALFVAPACIFAQEKTAGIIVHTKDIGAPVDMGRMALGQGGLSDQPIWEGREAEIRALRPKIIRLFVQEYFDLLPAKGRYHFDTLDRSVDLILRSGAKPLMSINFKPHVLFPKIDDKVVLPNDWGEWDRLIAALVRHYKQRGSGIAYWEVANEPDLGEDGGCPYHFTPADYVTYYRHTMRAILSADPDARVGGPALAGWNSPILPALLDACDKEKLPLHFVSWHGYASDPLEFRRTIEGVKNLLAKHPSLHPETILDEWNIALMNPKDDDLVYQAAFVLETIWHMMDAGLDYSCYYQIRDYHVEPAQFAKFFSPHGVAFMASWWNRRPQYDGLFDFQNEVRPAYFSFKLLSRLSGRRVKLETEGIRAFAAYDPEYEMQSVLFWNFGSTPLRTKLDWQGLEGKTEFQRIELDSRTPRSDEAARLKFLKPEVLSVEDHQREVVLEPYGIQLWFFNVARGQ